MSLIISLGTNVGDLQSNLITAKNLLSKTYKFIWASKILETKAVDYEKQNNFLNQLLEFEIPDVSPEKVLKQILEIEKKMGRVREFKYGPRIIDIDIIFWGNQVYCTPALQIPHPKYLEREFIIGPFHSLPFKKLFMLNIDSKPSQSIIKIIT